VNKDIDYIVTRRMPLTSVTRLELIQVVSLMSMAPI